MKQIQFADGEIGRKLLSWRFFALLAMACCVFNSVVYCITPTRTDALLRFLLFPASWCMLALLLFTCKYIRYFEVKLLAAFFLWMVVSALLNDWSVDGPLSGGWYRASCVAIFIGFSLPYAFSQWDARRVYRGMAALMVVLSTLLSAFALFCVLTGRSIASSAADGTAVFGMGRDGRLAFFGNPNSAGPICGAAVLLAVHLTAVWKSRPVRIALGISALVCYVALALTDSRTAVLSTSLGLALEAFVLGNGCWFSKRKSALRILLCLALAAAVLVGAYFGTAAVRAGYNGYAAARNTATEAEAPELQAAASRGARGMATMSSRTLIWKSVLEGFPENPRVLAVGATPAYAGDVMAKYFPEGTPVGNFHNSYLAILASFGIPGLLLFGAFLLLLAFACAKRIFTDMTDAESLGIRLIPALVLFAAAESMAEEFFFIGDMPSVVWLWMMFAGGTVFRLTKNE